MSVGFNHNQAILAGATSTPAPMPYSPSYSVPIQSGPQPLNPNMPVDNYESTRDKSVGDFVGGFFTGAAKSIYGMGEGLVFLGKATISGISNPVSAAKTVGRTALHVATHPWQTTQSIAKGIVKPYSTALKQGQYGEALGRLTVDLAVVTSAFAEKTPAPGPVDPPPTDAIDDIADVVDDIPPPSVATPVPPVGGPAGGASNNIVNDIKDVLLDNVGNGNITGDNNTINIIIGGGTQTASSTGTGAAAVNRAASVADDIGNVADDIGNVADDIGNVADDVASVASQTAGAANMGAQGASVGTRIGQGIDYILTAPAKLTNGIGNAVSSVGRGIQKVGNAILHPIDTLKGINPVSVTEWVAEGIRSGGNAVANGMIFAAHNPGQALVVAGAVGRGGKAAEDILSEMDIVR